MSWNPNNEHHDIDKSDYGSGSVLYACQHVQPKMNTTVLP